MNLLDKTMEAVSAVDDPELAAAIQGRLDRLTKPRSSLGLLEGIALRYGLASGRDPMAAPRKALFVFCGDHGITDEGVSAYPREVTGQMVRNFVGGGAAINVLCRESDIDPLVVDMGVDDALEGVPAVIRRKVAPGTRNFLRQAAMTREQAVSSLETGIRLAEAARKLEYGLLGVGEMGIGNTTSAAAVFAALSKAEAAEIVGRGTGIDDVRLAHKIAVVEQALALHRPDSGDPLGVLAAVGGFEIGGMTGFFLGTAARRVPVVVDGFIASIAAALAIRLCPASEPYFFFSHESAEQGHRLVLEFLGVRPLLQLDLRLGEGSGAALGMGLVSAALRLYREMATFESAAVSDSTATEGEEK